MSERPFKIDNEFSSLIPPASAEEVALLEGSVKRDGIIHPLIVWKEEKVLLDGHTRYKLALKHSLPHPIKQLSFDDRNQARNWLIDHQLGRRNINQEQRSYLLGKRYNSEKLEPHRPEKGGQNVHLNGKTAEDLAEKHGVSERTVRRAAKFADAVDALEQDEPGVAQAILAGESNATILDITKAVMLPPKKRKKAAKAIASGKKIEAELEPKHKSGKQVSDPRAWHRWDELFGKVKRAADDLNKSHPHPNLCRKLHADLDVAFHTAKEWRRCAK